MEPRSRRKLFAALIVTVAFGLAFGLMYVLWARFHPAYFYTSLAIYVVLLVLALLLVGRRPRDLDQEVEGDLEDATAAAGTMASATGAARAPVAVLETPEGIPIQVEKATGMALGMQVPTIAPAAAAAPARPFRLRGFTLYERDTKQGTQRFFARGKPVGGARPIPLPPTHTARWDNKKKRPALEPVPSPPTHPMLEPEPEVVVARPTAHVPAGVALRRPAAQEPPTSAVRPRPCAAFTSPGVMCPKPAREGTAYCAQHARYRPESVTQEFEVRRDARSVRPGGLRGGVGGFEVRLAKPSVKPLRLRAPEFEVRTARPSTHPAPPAGRGKAAKPAKPPVRGRPIRSPMERPFDVRVARPTVRPLRVRTPGELEARIARPKAPKPLRVRPAKEPVVRGGASLRDVEPLRLKPAREPVVRSAPSLDKAKPLRVAPSPMIVRTSKPNAKSVRLKAGREPVVRPSATLADAKPLRLEPADAFDVSTARGSLMASTNRAVRCMATLRGGGRCSNTARGGARYCTQHKNFNPRIEAVVVRDTRARTNLGVGDLDRPSPKKRSR